MAALNRGLIGTLVEELPPVCFPVVYINPDSRHLRMSILPSI